MLHPHSGFAGTETARAARAAVLPVLRRSAVAAINTLETVEYGHIIAGLAVVGLEDVPEGATRLVPVCAHLVDLETEAITFCYMENTTPRAPDSQVPRGTD